MNLFWPLLACSGVLLTILFEVRTWRKEHDMRKKLHVNILRSEKRGKRLSFILLMTSLGSLLVAFTILALYVRWTDSKDGVAVVFDVEGVETQKDASFQQRGFLQELVKGFKGIPLSLYERREESLSCLVPPTIDRLYFSLMADGIQPYPGSAPALDWIHKQVLEKEENSRPWVIVVSSRSIPQGSSHLDGISLVIFHGGKMQIQSFEHGSQMNEPSFEALSTRITSRILRSQEPSSIDGFEKMVLFIAVATAWFSAVQWRRRVSPVFFASFLFLAPCFDVFGVEKLSENVAVKQSADLVDAREYAAASARFEELLSSIVEERARQRMVYNLALVAHLRGDDRASLSWLDSVQKDIVDAQLTRKFRTLQVLSLTRLVQNDGGIGKSRKRLQDAIKDPIGLPSSVLAQASLTLLLPAKFVADNHAAEKTLVFYAQSLKDLFPSTMDQGNLSAFVLRTQKNVEKGLKTLFPDKIVDFFRKACSEGIKDPFFLTRYEPWFFVSTMKTQEDAIQFLLDACLMASTEAMFFPQRVSLLEKNLSDLKKLLDGKITLPSEDSPEALSAAWYVRARLWKLASASHERKQEETVLFLAEELERSLSPLIQEILAKELISFLHLSRQQYDSREPLASIFWQTYLAWFDKHPLDALDVLLRLAEDNGALWTKYVMRLLEERRKFMDLPLSRNLGEYDPILLARLVQIEQSPCSLPQEGVAYVSRMLHLYQLCLSQIQKPQSPFVNSLKVIFDEQIKVVESLHGLSVFKDDYTKRGNFEGHIDDLAKKTLRIKERIATLELEKIPYIKQDLQQCYDVLLKILRMLDEKEPSSEKEMTKRPTLPQEKFFSIREEEAVRLYQEMDRMDRTLYGE